MYPAVDTLQALGFQYPDSSIVQGTRKTEMLISFNKVVCRKKTTRYKLIKLGTDLFTFRRTFLFHF